MKWSVIAGVVALFATAGIASAGEPTLLDDAQLDQISAGSHASLPGIDLVYEINRPSGSHLTRIRLEDGMVEVLISGTVETQGLEQGSLYGLQFSNPVHP